MDLNKLLSELADEIDITDSQEGAIKRAYNGVADWLNQNDADISLHDVHIFPQGSMMYGTAIKPIDENDYDIDLVCEFRKNVSGLKPAYVKASVGNRIRENERYRKMLQPEGRRCWTLQYCDTLNFHMDILPSIPFREEYYRMDSRLNEAYSSMSVRKDLALLATDKDKETLKYKYIPTNPRGYAEWFKERMQTASSKILRDSVERVPEYPKKTILQRAIQLLKRHRDVYFSTRNDELKPISMIITTLMAKCYKGEDKLFEFICKALVNMESHIEQSADGKYRISNPVMSVENFADKWNETPKKATEFFDWVKQAYIDFTNLEEISTYTALDKAFKELFSQKPVDRMMQRYSSEFVLEKRLSLIGEGYEKPSSLKVLEKLSYRKSPPWVLPRKVSVGIQGKVSFDNGHSYKDFTSGTVLPKGAKLQFFPIHRLLPPYTVKWQITNTGEEARAANGLRGDRFENAELYRGGILCGKKEETSYSGTHYIQCFIIKNGNQCMAYSNPFVVKIR